ncbi:antibiotic biosynthesis monooxygenase [Streptomyces sp. B93]|uniref:antibiotic biosynthesis monooxygenase n=1 Tax=Streptomyces sp. B93 TaxID=2824875 RepID=UPI001B36C016|nr:antibiotic biosynthesis monooxygenase [Streptomyces sp. B93]MBQ1087603.1 antibiotic biosynthesis monooxygenase [Streptomyces sp. B93]
MTRRTDSHPDLTRPDVGAPFFSTWRVDTPDRQRATVAAIAHTWERREWPAPGLLAYHVYTGGDGATLLHHSQWTAEHAYEAFARTRRQERVDEIDTAVPGIRRQGLDRYRHYRSHARAAGDTRVPGLVVTVRIDFEPDARGRRRDWTDTVLTALTEEPDGHDGLIAAHFHLSGDGGHVLNYAEWESDQAYDAALAAPGAGIGAPTPLWERVRTYPGVKGFTGSRYEHALGLVPG